MELYYLECLQRYLLFSYSLIYVKESFVLPSNRSDVSVDLVLDVLDRSMH